MVSPSDTIVPRADVAQERIVVPLVEAEIRAGLLDLVQAVADDPLEIVDDVGAVAEQQMQNVAELLNAPRRPAR